MARQSKTHREHSTPAKAPQLAERTFPAVARNRHLLALAILWVATIAAYSSSFKGGMVFDNQRAILQDTRIRAATAENLHLIWTQDYWYRSSAGGLFRPLTTLSYLFNYAILGNGTQTAGYHAVNLLLQLINVALVYWLALLILQEWAPALALAALWGLHPILTESVTNIVGRADEIAAMGVLAGLLCFAKCLQPGPRRAMWVAAIAAASAVGIFSKESAIVLLAAMVLYDVSFRPDSSWQWRAAGYAAAVLPICVYLAMRSNVLSRFQILVVPFTDNPLTGADFLTARITAVKVIGSYLWLLLLPIHLSCDHSFAQIPLFSWRFDNAEDWKALLAIVVFAALVAVVVMAWRRSKPVFFFVTLFFATLAPTSNLVVLIGSPMAERFLYLPSIGFAGCVVWMGWKLLQRISQPGRASQMASIAAAVVCLAFAGRTFARNFDWRDERALWTSAVRESPGSYRAHENLALSIINNGNFNSDFALGEMEHALAIVDQLPDIQKIPRVWATLGLCYRLRGDLLAQSAASQPGYSPQSNPWYRKALATFLRGEAIDKLWGQEVARRNLEAGKIISNAGWPPLYLGLGRLYVRLGEPEKALETFSYGRSLGPQLELFQEMAGVYRSMGANDQAAIALMEGLTMDPGMTSLLSQLVQLYRETEPLSCAVTPKGLNLACPLVHEQICMASSNVATMESQMRQREKAAQTAQRAVQSFGCPAEMFR